uniref:Polycomb complex protein BMI-1 n=1 Tax=Schistosoma japonicum TaxID=6182 RepID=C1LEQ7_SCHJA|nr:Polycomb complex protein BMI-1 [Schistosoma japonicum]
MHRVSDVPVTFFNPYLTCNLCRGYLIDATTIVECLHSFCRSCILTYLKLNTTCPVCETLLHKTKPHCAIRPDRALQAIVYKLIPNLFEKEMLCRRKFYEAHPSYHSRSLSPEKRGDITLNTYVLQEEDRLSVELRYWNQNEHKFDDCSSKTSSQIDSINTMLAAFPPTFLLCPPELTVGHIEKLIRMKFNLKPSEHDVSVFFSVDDLFNSDHTLSDLACLYAWRRQQPFKLYFTIKETPKHTLSTVMEFQPPSTASSQTHNVIEKSERCTQGNNNTFCSVKSKLKNLPTSSLRKRHVNNSDDELEITPVEVSASNSQVSSKSSCKISLPTQFIKSISLSSSMLNTSNSVCSSLA